MRKFASVFSVLGMLLMGSGEARAQDCVADHCDFLVARLMITGEDCGTQTFDHSQTSEYSRLVTGARDFGTFPISNLYPVFVYNERLDGTNAADDPGFTAVPSPCSLIPVLSPIPPSTGLYVDFLTEEPTAGGAARNLLYWDGIDDDMNGLDEDDVDWSPVPIDEIMRLDDFGDVATADGGTSELPGILIETSTGTSSVHKHIDFELRRSGGGLASAGIYMLRLDLTIPGFAEGAPVYMIFGTPGQPLTTEDVARTQVENELVKPLCSDGVDNDRDGFTDFAGGDPGCSNANDDSEKAVGLACDDGIDNDGDGDIDFRSVNFGIAGIYGSRDQECESPTDASGEAPAIAIPATPRWALVLLAAMLVAAFAAFAMGRPRVRSA